MPFSLVITGSYGAMFCSPLILLLLATVLSIPAEGRLSAGRWMPWRQQPTDVYCADYPLPTLDPASLTAKMSPFLDELASEINATLQANRDTGGVALGFVYNQTLVWFKGFGLIDNSDPERGPPHSDTSFRIASITKVFTALLMLQIRDEGLLPSIDDEVATYNENFSIINPFQTTRGPSFRQLASHMAGLPRETPCEGVFVTGCNATYETIYQNLASLVMINPPGSIPSYSNLGFGLLGRTLEAIDHSTWEEMLQERILTPLGMVGSGSKFTLDVIKNMAKGYNPDGSEADLINLGFEAPGGQMFSTVNDLAQLLMLVFRSDEALDPKQKQILDGETIREWMEPAFMYNDGTGLGYPWEFFTLGDYSIRSKGGDINGYDSLIAYTHEIKTGFIFLQSCRGCPSFAPIISLACTALLQVSSVLASSQQAPSIPPNPQDYTGVYSGLVISPQETMMNITLGAIDAGPVLVASISGGLTLVLEWHGEDTFKLSTRGLSVHCVVQGGGV
eukprot:Em0021g785a